MISRWDSVSRRALILRSRCPGGHGAGGGPSEFPSALTSVAYLYSPATQGQGDPVLLSVTAWNTLWRAGVPTHVISDRTIGPLGSVTAGRAARTHPTCVHAAVPGPLVEALVVYRCRPRSGRRWGRLVGRHVAGRGLTPSVWNSRLLSKQVPLTVDVYSGPARKVIKRG